MRSALLVETEDELLVVPIVLLVFPLGIVSALSAAEAVALPLEGVATAVFLAARLEAVAVAVLFAVRPEAVLLPDVAVATELLPVAVAVAALPATEVEMSPLLAVAAATALAAAILDAYLQRKLIAASTVSTTMAMVSWEMP